MKIEFITSEYKFKSWHVDKKLTGKVNSKKKISRVLKDKDSFIKYFITNTNDIKLPGHCHSIKQKQQIKKILKVLNKVYGKDVKDKYEQLEENENWEFFQYTTGANRTRFITMNDNTNKSLIKSQLLIPDVNHHIYYDEKFNQDFLMDWDHHDEFLKNIQK